MFLIGEPPTGWDDSEKRKEDTAALQQKNMRVLLYKELLDNAQRIYKEYLEKRKDKGRIMKLLTSIDEADLT